MRCPRCHRDLPFPAEFAELLGEPAEEVPAVEEAAEETTQTEAGPDWEFSPQSPIRLTLCLGCCQELLDFMRLLYPETSLRIRTLDPGAAGPGG